MGASKSRQAGGFPQGVGYRPNPQPAVGREEQTQRGKSGVQPFGSNSTRDRLFERAANKRKQRLEGESAPVSQPTPTGTTAPEPQV